MRLVKLLFFSLLFFALLLTAISLLLPSQVRISKAMTVQATKDSVAAMVTDTARWKNWHPLLMEPAQRKGVHIEPVQKNDSLFIARLVNADKKSLQHTWQFFQYETGDSSAIQWVMEFDLGWYPWKKFGSMFYDKTYGGIITQGLENIKSQAENKQALNKEN